MNLFLRSCQLIAANQTLLLKSVRVAAALLHSGVEFSLPTQAVETAVINVTKPYKKRRLKTDPAHRLTRQAYKYKKLNPAVKRKRKVYEKQYRRKNKQALKRRGEFVRRTKKAQGLD